MLIFFNRKTIFLQVRAIAKKYKLQYDQMAIESSAKEQGAEKAQQTEASLAATQTQLAEAQTKLTEAEAEVQKLQLSVSEATKQVIF